MLLQIFYRFPGECELLLILTYVYYYYYLFIYDKINAQCHILLGQHCRIAAIKF